MEGEKKVCVTGGTGFLASWLIYKLLQNGYYVNTTIRPSSPEHKKDVKYLTDLPNASEKLRIFVADLSNPKSFESAIEGCVGVFHVAHPMNFGTEESEEENTRKSINGTLGILQLCLDSKTVKKVVYTSSASTVMFHDHSREITDESSWSNVELIRRLNGPMSLYALNKTLTEKSCLEFAEKHGLDLVTVIPTWIHGPFITPSVPGSVGGSMALFFEREISAGIQQRIGPEYAGPLGILQAIADGTKLLFKENLLPSRGDTRLFSIGPSIAVVAVLLSYSVIPFGYHLILADLSIGVFLWIAISSIAPIGQCCYYVLAKMQN